MENQQQETDILAREENCRKAIKTVSRAIFMRLFVIAILVWVMTRTQTELWVIGLMALVLVINLTGMLPLFTEWKKRRVELKQILAEEET